MDGGIACNYPLNFCIESGKDPDEILGFKNKYSDEKSDINEGSTILDYLLNFLFKSVFNIQNNYIQPHIKNEVLCDASYLTLDILKNTLSNIEARRELFKKGKKTASDWLEKYTLQNSV